MKQKFKRTLFPFHPLLFAIFPAVSILSGNLHILSPADIIFPIFLFVVLAVCLWLGLFFVFRDIIKTGLITSLSLFLFFSYGHISSIIYDTFFQETTFKEHLILLTIFFGLLILISLYIIKSKHSLHNASSIINIVAISSLLVPIVIIGSYFPEQDFSIREENMIDTNYLGNNINTAQLPDIYLIVLDSYTNEKILNDLFNFDNSDFVSFLSSKKFFITDNSFSHYHTSFLSIASMLNMEYINNLTNDVGENSKNRYLAYKMIDQNTAMKIAKSKGYVTVNIDSGWEATRHISAADLNLCGKNQFLNSQTIVMMIRNSMLNPIYVKIFESDYRERISCTFSSISSLHQEIEQPIFVFAHIFLPHGPYYWGPNGEYYVPEQATLEGFKKDKEGFTDQLQFTNKKTKQMITKILNESETSPIIILTSDHGTMLSHENDSVTDDYIFERMSNIMYVHVPDNNDLFYDGMSYINLLRIIYNSYLAQNFSYLEDRYYFSDDEKPYRWMDVTEFLLKNKKINLGFFND